MKIKCKLTHSTNALRLLQLSIIIFPYSVILLINLISGNLKVFTTFGFVIFSIAYLLFVFLSCKFFILDWDLYKSDNKIIFKNILGNSTIINNCQLKKIEIKNILGILPYFKIIINNREFVVRYIPKSNSYIKNYFKIEKMINKLKKELKHDISSPCSHTNNP